MGIKLEDIIDLDYLVARDEILESSEDIKKLAQRDRAIYAGIEEKSLQNCDLLLAWLKARKEQLQHIGEQGSRFLPGLLFSMIYRWMAWLMLVAGGLSGFALAGSFLIYHGVKPVNVTVFSFLFIAVPFALSLTAFVFGLTKFIWKGGGDTTGPFFFFYMIVSFLFFNLVPKFFRKIYQGSLKNHLKDIEYAGLFLEIKKNEYRELFFWPFFMLSSLFAAAFSTGAMVVTFFKVVVSDMAFGWQSTLVSTGNAVHELVSMLSFPWATVMPDSIRHLAHPSLEQIEGSRIVLKDGIAVLASSDLASWWPFLCLSILVYAVLTRIFLWMFALGAQKNNLLNLDIDRPGFRELIIRMTSPVLDIEANGKDDDDALEEVHEEEDHEAAEEKKSDVSGSEGLLLLPDNIYPDEHIEAMRSAIKNVYGVNVCNVINVSMDESLDPALIENRAPEVSGPVIFVYEAWQAPIRGLLYYISMIQNAVCQNRSVWVMLTSEAGSEQLFLDDDKDMEVWKKAVLKFKNPNILVRGLFKP